MNKEKINEAITILAKSYSTNNSTLIEKAIKTLRESDELFKAHEPFNGADQLPQDTSIFYTIGVPWLDNWLCARTGCGVRKQEVVLFAGLPSAGKTHFLAWFGSNALLEGANVVDIFGEDLTIDKQELYVQGTNNNKDALKNLWLYDMQERNFGVPEIENALAYFKSKKIKIDILILDHMDLLNAGSGFTVDDDWRAVAAKSRDLKLLARREDIILVTASQAVPLQGGGISLYAGKTSKKANVDILILIQESSGQQYVIKLDKARGRKPKPGAETKMLLADWDSMVVAEL